MRRSGLEGDGEFLEVGSLASKFFTEMLDLFLTFGHPSNEVPCTLYFIVGEVLNGCSELINELVDDILELVTEANLRVTFTRTILSGFKLESVSVIIISVVVPVERGIVNGLSLAELRKGLYCLDVEEVGISAELVGDRPDRAKGICRRI